MRTAVRCLFDVKAPFIRTSAAQLKVGRINFYADSGTIYLDGDRAPLPQRGLHAFQELLRTIDGLVAAGLANDPRPRPEHSVSGRSGDARDEHVQCTSSPGGAVPSEAQGEPEISAAGLSQTGIEAPASNPDHAAPLVDESPVALTLQGDPPAGTEP